MSKLHDELINIFGEYEIADNSKNTVFHSDWEFCVTCMRRPAALAVMNKHNQILCCINRHHDHIREHVWDVWGKVVERPGWGEWFNAVGDLISRFPETEVCSFCNEAEGKAKKLVNADKHFSFSPEEMSRFIVAPFAGPVEIDEQAARAIWEDNKSRIAYRKKLADRLVELALAGRIGMVDSPLILKEIEDTEICHD